MQSKNFLKDVVRNLPRFACLLSVSIERNVTNAGNRECFQPVVVDK